MIGAPIPTSCTRCATPASGKRASAGRNSRSHLHSERWNARLRVSHLRVNGTAASRPLARRRPAHVQHTLAPIWRDHEYLPRGSRCAHNSGPQPVGLRRFQDVHPPVQRIRLNRGSEDGVRGQHLNNLTVRVCLTAPLQLGARPEPSARLWCGRHTLICNTLVGPKVGACSDGND
jgi:hypothetical protein